jgi:hypothetical protein
VRIIAPNHGLGDYVPGAGAVWGVHSAEGAGPTTMGAPSRGVYSARVMVRSRHDDTPMAEDALKQALPLMLALRRQTIRYTMPDGTVRAYRVRGVRHMNGPESYAQPPGAGGYAATSNYELRVQEVAP